MCVISVLTVFLGPLLLFLASSSPLSLSRCSTPAEILIPMRSYLLRDSPSKNICRKKVEMKENDPYDAVFHHHLAVFRVFPLQTSEVSDQLVVVVVLEEGTAVLVTLSHLKRLIGDMGILAFWRARLNLFKATSSVLGSTFVAQ